MGRSSCVRFFALACAMVPAGLSSVMAAEPAVVLSVDPIRSMQAEAQHSGRASWGHWGDQPDRYASWSNHSNRLVPVYTFGMTLQSVTGKNSVYRSAKDLARLYGRVPDNTLNPTANYCDQTDVYRLQQEAVAAGKTRIILLVFDGLDWTTTRTAAIATTGTVAYREGRGTGLSFQDYRGAPTDFGACVTSPANSGTLFDVDAQAIHNPGGTASGGYDPLRGGVWPWDAGGDLRYLMGRSREQPHAVTDSAASATSLFTGRKTYNDAINVDVRGNPVEPVAAMLQRQGWAIGVVSSVPVSHATPACTYANNVSRDDYQDIARDLLGLKSISHKTDPLPGVDVLIGGGFGVDVANDQGQGRNFEPGNKYVADSTLQEIDSAVGGRYQMALRTPGQSGATVLAKAAAEAVAGKHRLFGFFGIPEGNLPFQTADGDVIPVNAPPESPDTQDALKKKYSVGSPYTPADINENPTLADMTRAALDVLGTKQRFWLMVEPGDVDWACHANNIDNCIGAIRSGDAAFRAVVEWIERTDTWNTTVVILTSDHGHLFVLTEPEAFVTPD